MSSNIMVAAALAVLAASSAPAAQATQHPRATTPIIVHPPAGAGTSTIHDWDGQRFDVPDDLLRSPRVLINGLAPLPVEFD